ncbi:MAG: DUF1109 domain-containing protein [Pseudomonadota bacterium]
MKESTSQLINRLSSDLAPTPRHVLDSRLAAALVIGAAAAFVLLTSSLGLRADLSTAVATWTLWGKLLYAAALVAGGYVLCGQAARPAAHPRWRIIMVLLPIGIAVIAALWRSAVLSSGARTTEWLGATAAICPWLIGLLSLPCLLALCFVMRRAAPTRLRWAGFCAGLLAGAISMLVYALHCPETGLAFVASWYTLGMCLPAALGALMGPQLLRWR